MMEEKQTIIGAGMGAVMKFYFPEEDKIKRVPNFKSLNEYINTGIIKGFKSKENNLFNAVVAFDEAYKTVFEFPPKNKKRK